jgi:hypothetical protein
MYAERFSLAQSHFQLMAILGSVDLNASNQQFRGEVHMVATTLGVLICHGLIA